MADLFISVHPSFREELFIPKMTREIKPPGLPKWGHDCLCELLGLAALFLKNGVRVFVDEPSLYTLVPASHPGKVVSHFSRCCSVGLSAERP